jgi:hypothetical protein
MLAQHRLHAACDMVYNMGSPAAEYVRVTRELLPRLSDLKFPWICFHGEGDSAACVAHFSWSL